MSQSSHVAADAVSPQAKTLMTLLASINRDMAKLAHDLRQRPSVAEVRHGCDLREYKDAFRYEDQPFCAFEVYVEADLVDGTARWWLLDVNCTPTRWELSRSITHDSAAGQDTEMLKMLSSPHFTEFAARAPVALFELLELARSGIPGSEQA
ncbi:hypothetical protein ACQR10_24880 [Bradyrhizobium sp. HKCCYLRH2060]|uniref:hypothetical protein n=1 Tax=Bradyrhizobium TaxID=374 RepID=UPI0029163857|nr:hypothetical protein [Bradyrhizobium sp. SZCCHNR3003]